jgi:hypothetical protein
MSFHQFFFELNRPRVPEQQQQHATPPAESTRQGDETRLGCAGEGFYLRVTRSGAVRSPAAGRPGGEEVSALRGSIAAERAA